MQDTETKADFRFDYAKYKTKSISIEKLDLAFDKVFAPDTSTIGKYLGIVWIIVTFAYIWIRRGLIDEQERLEKQEYEIRRVNQSSGTLETDDLDQLRSEAEVERGVHGVDS